MSNTFAETYSEKQVAKGEILQHSGDTQIQAFFVKSGLLRSYYLDNKGKEHTFMFAPENWFIMDFSPLTNIPCAQLTIDALENSEIYVIPKSLVINIHKLPEEELKNQIQRFINRIGTLQTRVVMLMSATAEERYVDFLKTYPNIAQRVPQKMIAAYLGITPESLSRARKKISRP
ncbi:MAG: hypothetical protein RLZZ262_688 [Bacteroidota bacterium]|jgi:CRP/FNR family transcriptional regulator, anaerobic regulatory protein